MIKFTVNQESFSDILQCHLPVIPSRTTLPILNSLCWRISEGKLSIHSTDLEISLMTEISVESEGSGDIVIPAKKIFDIIHELPPGNITITIEDNYRVIIEGLTGVYRIAGGDSDDFPPLPSSEKLNEISMPSSKLHRMVEHTAFSVSKDDLRPTLCGMYFQVKENEFLLVSTDGHRLSKIVDHSVRYEDESFDMIIPLKGLNLAVRSPSEDSDITVTRSDRYVKISFPGGEIYSQLIEGKYPIFDNVIPKSNQNILVVKVDTLMAAVRRVAIFSNSISHQIRFKLESGKIDITAEDVDIGGDAHEEIELDYQGEDMVIGYNANYLLDALRQIETEEVKITLGNPDSAVIILPIEQQEGEDLLMLLMPVRLS